MSDFVDVKVRAMLSTPMVGWQPHFGAVQKACQPLGIPVDLGFGAFWHQIMSNMMEDAVADGIDWILTLDYDSMFTAQHLDRLLGQFGSNPEIDALAALQCKRSPEEVPLLTTQNFETFDQDGDTCRRIELTGKPIPVETAHFGLTLFRAESLKKVPMPWFLGLPDDKGSYKTLNRIDADIFFWKKWQHHGCTAYVDTGCKIGHLQPMVSEFDEHGSPRHVHVTDWRTSNRGVA